MLSETEVIQTLSHWEQRSQCINNSKGSRPAPHLMCASTVVQTKPHNFTFRAKGFSAEELATPHESYSSQVQGLERP